MSLSRRTRRKHWPVSGSHRQLLEHLDKVREEGGRRTYAAIAKRANLAESRISEFLTGKAIPSKANVKRLVSAMGGGDDEATFALRLLVKCTSPAPARAPRPPSNSRRMANDSSVSLSQAIQDTAVLYRDLDVENFTGRAELTSRILNFIDSRSRGYVVVRAEAGIGKTALAAHLVNRYGYIYHFTGIINGQSTAHAFRNLSAQLIRRYGVVDSEEIAVAPGADAGSFEGFWSVLTAALKSSSNEKPIVIVIDGLDEFEFASPKQTSLGLPSTLPDGVFIIITSRFGGEARLTSLRTPSEWLTLDVQSTDNISDMRHYIDRVTDTKNGDPQLLTRIAGTNVTRLCHILITRCAGVWIYLKYVLDEIRDGRRTVAEIGGLPTDLGGYYAHNMMMWRGDLRDSLATENWRLTTLPLLTTLAAIREPLPIREISHLANVERQAATAFLTGSARAFLNRDCTGEVPLYSIRHESFRDLLRSRTLAMSMPVMSLLADDLQNAVADADARIVEALVPPGWPDDARWQECSPYANRHLAHHAAACGRLDAMLADPGFLVSVSAESILTSNASARTEAGRLAARVLFLSLQDWDKATTDERISFVNMWATRLGAHDLSISSAKHLNRRWRISYSILEWPGKRSISDREVTAIDIKFVNGRVMIATGYFDGGVSVFDANTGMETGEYPVYAGGVEIAWVAAVQIFQGASQTILVAGWEGDPPVVPLQAWDVETRQILWTAAEKSSIFALGATEFNGRTVLAYTYGDPYSTESDCTNGMAIRDLETGDRISYTKFKEAGYYLDITKIGKRTIIAVSSVGIFDLGASFKLTPILKAEEMWSLNVGPVAFDASPDSPMLMVMVSVHNRIEFIDALTGKSMRDPLVVGDESMQIDDLRFDEMGRREVIFVGTCMQSDCDRVEATLWDINTRQELDRSRRDESESIVLAAYEHKAERIVALGSRSGLQVWEPKIDDPIQVEAYPSAVNHLSFGRVSGRDVVVAGRGDFGVIGSVSVYDTDTKKILVPTLEWPGCSVSAASIGTVRRRNVVIAGGYLGARIWDLHTSELLVEVADEDVKSVEIVQLKDRHLAIIVNFEGMIRAFSISSNWSLSPVYEVRNNFTDIAVTIGRGSVHECSVAVISDTDEILRTYDLASGKRIGEPVQTSARTDAMVEELAVCNVDGRWVVFSCGRSGEILRCEPLSGEVDLGCLRIAVAEGPTWAAAAGYSNGRVMLATGGEHGILTIRDGTTGIVVDSDLRGHSDGVQALIMDCGGRIVSGGTDGALTWWEPAL